MAALATRSTFLLQQQRTLPVCSVIFSRGLKKNQLYKKKKKRKIKERDGKEVTVEHIFWDKYYADNPSILAERQMINTKSSASGSTVVEGGGSRPLSARKVYDTLTTGDKRLAIAGVFALVTGFIAMKITFA
ncbi:uncharacterized protein [Clytia hemisphaerica]|uniref:Uncharacterized protein n=1 Tax=Clytia hemisphaerica TaxID=252671 RepID=A0A7M5X0I5_9CNID